MVIELKSDIVYRVSNLPSLHRSYPLMVCVDVPTESYLYEFVKGAAERQRFSDYCKKEYKNGIMYEIPSFVAIEKLMQRAEISEDNRSSGGKLLSILTEALCEILDEYGEPV